MNKKQYLLDVLLWQYINHIVKDYVEERLIKFLEEYCETHDDDYGTNLLNIFRVVYANNEMKRPGNKEAVAKCAVSISHIKDCVARFNRIAKCRIHKDGKVDFRWIPFHHEAE